MVDIQTIIQSYKSKRSSRDSEQKSSGDLSPPTTSEIPDIFFDEILVNFKLTRIEVVILMYLYRRVWSRPNMYKEYGISQLLSHTEMSKNLNVSIGDIHQSLRHLEEYGFIETIRSGQYFCRRYFTKENDDFFGQYYDEFDF